VFLQSSDISPAPACDLKSELTAARFQRHISPPSWKDPVGFSPLSPSNVSPSLNFRINYSFTCPAPLWSLGPVWNQGLELQKIIWVSVFSPLSFLPPLRTRSLVLPLFFDKPILFLTFFFLWLLPSGVLSVSVWSNQHCCFFLFFLLHLRPHRGFGNLVFPLSSSSVFFIFLARSASQFSVPFGSRHS